MIAIGYGIMDCESSVVHANWDTVDSMLQNVLPLGTATTTETSTTTQVVDAMNVNQEWDLDIETFTKMSETTDNIS